MYWPGHLEALYCTALFLSGQTLLRPSVLHCTYSTWLTNVSQQLSCVPFSPLAGPATGPLNLVAVLQLLRSLSSVPRGAELPRCGLPRVEG